MVKDSLMNEEFRRKELSTNFEARALVTDKQERRGRSRNKGSTDKDENFNKSRGRSKSTRRNIKCYHCDKPGHLKR